MVIFKFLQRFLLPSVFIPILILLGLILLLKLKEKRVGKTLIIFGLALYYILSVAPIADLVLKPLESQYQPVQEEEWDRTDKVVLLLGGRESNVLRASEVIRICHNKNFQFPISNFQIIVSGRDPLNSKINEAGEVKKHLVERGIPSGDIILEDKSRNTAESAKNIKEIVGKEPFFLVTSAYHMPRAMEIFQKVGASSIAAPTDFKIKNQYDILDFFPNSANLKKTDLAFHEYFGILFYRIYY